MWVVEELPPGTNLLTPKWARKVKQSGKHKSRLCVRGFKQIHRIDYNETFAPVAKIVTFCVTLTLIALLSLYTDRLDV